MTLPDFLIIGAMKAGTTSLYRDLLSNPSVFMPIDKELDWLRTDNVLTPEGRAEYERHFAKAMPGQICGEASTSYTMLPRHPDVPARARELIGPECRVIYIVREPVARIMSHLHHAHNAGRMPETDVNRAIHTHHQLIDFSRYAMQIEPWIETFGADRVRILRAETYREHRLETVAELSRFLGIEPRPELVNVDVFYNKGAGKPVTAGPFVVVQRHPIYRRLIRPLLPVGLKDRLQLALFPRAKPAREPPSAETIEFVYETLDDDMTRLAALMGVDTPIWNVDDVKTHYGANEASTDRTGTSPPS